MNKFKKIITCIILISVLVNSVVYVNAEEELVYEDGIYYSVDGTTVVKSDYAIKAANIKEGPTRIGGKAFWGRYYLTEVNISSTIDTIGTHAFCCCYDLESVVIPSNVETIETYAFFLDNKLSNVVLPEGVQTIEYGAFTGCALDNITLPASATSVSYGAFDFEIFTYINVAGDNPKYSSLDGVWYNKDKTFLYRYPGKKAGTEYVVPEGVTEVAMSAFDDCDILEKVVLPEGIESIETGVFSNCDNLMSINIPNSVVEIDSYAFRNSDGLETVYIPKGVETLESSAFWECNSLYAINVDPDNPNYTSIDGVLYDKEVTQVITYPAGKQGPYNVPEGFEEVGNLQFQDCDGLTSVNIPASVTSIQPNAFTDCDNLTAINVDPDNPNYTSVDGVLFNKDKTVLVSYPAGKDASSYVIPDTVTEICQYAFSGCDKLISVTIPDSIEKIDRYNFSKCSNLTDVILSEGLTRIECYAFYECKKIAAVSVPKSVTFIDDDAFGRNLKTVYGHGGSYAEQFAQEENLKFVDLDAPPAIDISEAIVTIPALEETGYVINVTPTVTYNGTVLVKDVDYNLSGDCSVVTAGTYNIVITGIGNYSGEKTVSFIVEQKSEEQKPEQEQKPSIVVPSDAYISSKGVYVAKMDRTGITAGVVAEGNKEYAEYSWWACEGNSENWFLIQDWALGLEWLDWTPDKYGDYVIVGKVRLYDKPETEVSSNINISYHPQIKGKCQMPYTGEGGGYLIGVESYENPNQSYQYEMLVLDCTLLAEGKDAWIYTTGKFTVPEGNAAWTVWQPQYGYYWTLFRVYDAEGNLLDEQCYGFVNAY